MNDELKKRCENSFYSELYHFDDAQQDLLLDMTTGRVMLKKTLETYDKKVYEWLKSNPCVHIPAVYSCREEDGKLTVLEEYIQGQTLEDAIEAKSYDEDALFRIISDVCDALIFLHSADTPIIHRDIKASNIMISNDGVVKLIDFNASKQFHAGKKSDTTLIGTAGSAAPEQYGFAQSDERTDIYSLGVLIKELFPEDKRFTKIIEKATRMEPKHRYQSVSEMKQALFNAYRPQHKKLPKYALIAVSILLLALFSAVLIKHGSPETNDIKKTDTTANTYTAAKTDNTTETAATTENITATKPTTTAEPLKSSSPLENLVIEESCYRISETMNDNEAQVHFAAVLFNKDESAAIDYPAIRVTARDSRNTVIGTETTAAFNVMPGDKIVLSGYLTISDYNKNDEISVDYSITSGTPLYDADEPSNSDFSIEGVSEHYSAMFPYITGEVTSAFNSELSIAVTALLKKNGSLVDAETGYVDNVRPNEPAAFKIDMSGEIPEHDSVDIMVQKW